MVCKNKLHLHIKIDEKSSQTVLLTYLPLQCPNDVVNYSFKNRENIDAHTMHSYFFIPERFDMGHFNKNGFLLVHAIHLKKFLLHSWFFYRVGLGVYVCLHHNYCEIHRTELTLFNIQKAMR